MLKFVGTYTGGSRSVSDKYLPRTLWNRIPEFSCSKDTGTNVRTFSNHKKGENNQGRICIEDESQLEKEQHSTVPAEDGAGMLPIKQIQFKRRQFMAPGSRIASLLPQQYWQVTGEKQEVIEMAAGTVNLRDASKSGEQTPDVALITNDEDLAGGTDKNREFHPNSVSSQSEGKEFLGSPSEVPVFGKKAGVQSLYRPGLTRRRSLNVSSRLQLMEGINEALGDEDDPKELVNYHKKDEDEK